MRKKAVDAIRKFRILIAFELLILTVLGLFLVFKKSGSFSLTSDMIIPTAEGLEAGYLCENESAVADIIIPAENKADNLNLCIWMAQLPAGVYEAKINYSAVYDYIPNNDPFITIVTFDSDGDTSYFSDDTILPERLTQVTSRIYSVPGHEEMYAFFRMKGNGRIRIDSLEIREYKPWRLLAFISLFLIFAIADAVLFVFAGKDRSSKRVLASLLTLFIITSFPLFNKTVLYGHDYGFHMYRVGSLARGMMEGNIPVRFMSGAYNGFGYIIDVLYSNLLMVPAAIVYMLGAPLSVSYNFCLIYINILTIILAYYAFTKTFGSRKWGVLGSFLYTLSMYRLCDLYIRSDEGETFAMAFLPLAVYGFIRIYRSEDRRLKNILPLVIGISGIIQSHVLSTLFAAFFIFIFCIINLRKTLKKLPELLLSVVLILFINLFYLYPVVTSFIGMGLKAASDMSFKIYEAALNFSQIFDLKFIPGHSGKDVDMYFGTGLFIIIALIMLIAGIVISYTKKTEKPVVRIGIESLIMALLASFIAGRLFPWEAVSESTGIIGIFNVVQFPWRFMEYATVFFCFAAVSGIALISRFMEEKKITRAVVPAFCIGTAVIAVVFIYSYVSISAKYVFRDVPLNGILDWAPTPEGLDRNASADDNLVIPGEAIVSRDLKGTSGFSDMVLSYEVLTERDSEKAYKINNGAGDVSVLLPVYAFENVIVTDGAGKVYETGIGENYRISLEVPSGDQNVYNVRYRIPVIWRICDLISAFALFLTVLSPKWIKNREIN